MIEECQNTLRHIERPSFNTEILYKILEAPKEKLLGISEKETDIPEEGDTLKVKLDPERTDGPWMIFVGRIPRKQYNLCYYFKTVEEVEAELKKLRYEPHYQYASGWIHNNEEENNRTRELYQLKHPQDGQSEIPTPPCNLMSRILCYISTAAAGDYAPIAVTAEDLLNNPRAGITYLYCEYHVPRHRGSEGHLFMSPVGVGASLSIDSVRAGVFEFAFRCLARGYPLYANYDPRGKGRYE